MLVPLCASLYRNHSLYVPALCSLLPLLFAHLLEFQRIQLYNAFANSAMCKNNISVLDVYPISNSYPPGTMDGIHYKDEAFYPVIDLLQEYFSSSPSKDLSPTHVPLNTINRQVSNSRPVLTRVLASIK